MYRLIELDAIEFCHLFLAEVSLFCFNVIGGVVDIVVNVYIFFTRQLDQFQPNLSHPS